MVETFEEEIRIAAPVHRVFTVWQDFDTLQQLVRTVEHVDRIEPQVSRWMLHAPFNLRISYTAHITSVEENDHIAWTSEHDSQTKGGHQGPVSNTGRIEFEPVDGGEATLVHVRVTYTLPGEKAQHVVNTLNALGYPTREISRALEDIRDYIQDEYRTQATAA